MRVDGQTARPARKLKAKERVVFTPPPIVTVEDRPENIPLTVLYEDSHLIVIDKPAGMVVHPATSHQAGTLVNALLHHCGDSLQGVGGERRPGIVHRLDKDTSGVMVVAKNEPTLVALQTLFAAHDLERSYVAIVEGVVAEQGSFKTKYGRDPNDRKKFSSEVQSGKRAVTHWRVRRAARRRDARRSVAGDGADASDSRALLRRRARAHRRSHLRAAAARGARCAASRVHSGGRRCMRASSASSIRRRGRRCAGRRSRPPTSRRRWRLCAADRDARRRVSVAPA